MRKKKIANVPLQSDATQRILALVGLGIVWFLTKPKSGLSGPVEKVIDAAPVYEGETVSADSYRRIGSPRLGMSYIQCSGALGERLTFTVSKTGVFTRNVILSDGAVWAEISP
jgi:hypothetical protein